MPKRPDPDLVPVSQSHVRQIDAYRVEHPEAGHNTAWHATLMQSTNRSRPHEMATIWH